MEKIKTLFQRNPEDRRHVTREVEPGCEWVIAGEGIATQKYDGTCVMWDGTAWWARREVKPGKQPPAGFQQVNEDPVTGKLMGWEPGEQSAFSKYLTEALEDFEPQAGPGTFELCGPKINGNPEGYDRHLLLRHAYADVLRTAPRDYDGLSDYLHQRPELEGIVWHHPDGRMVKIKRRDFPAGSAGSTPEGDLST